MVIKEVTRSYSRSINTKSYGNQAESWVKVEAVYTATCESGDDPLKVSQVLAEQAQADVATQVSAIIEKIKQANPRTVPGTMAPAMTVPVASVAAAPVPAEPRQL